MEPNALAHHGILGMKWGVRRTPEQLGHKKESANSKIKKSTIIKASAAAISAVSMATAYSYVRRHLDPVTVQQFQRAFSTPKDNKELFEMRLKTGWKMFLADWPEDELPLEFEGVYDVPNFGRARKRR